MRKNNKRFRGFTLAEMLVALAIVGIIAAAVVPIAKPKAMKHNPFRRPHGIVECFYDSHGNLIEYFRDDKSEFTDIRNGRWRNLGPSAEYCEVDVPDSDYYKLHVINAGENGEYYKKADTDGYSVVQTTEDTKIVSVNTDYKKNMEAAFNGKNAKYKTLFDSLKPQAQFTLVSPYGAYGHTSCRHGTEACSKDYAEQRGGAPGDKLTVEVNATLKHDSNIQMSATSLYDTCLWVGDKRLCLSKSSDGSDGILLPTYCHEKRLLGICFECYCESEGHRGGIDVTVGRAVNPFGSNAKKGDKYATVFTLQDFSYESFDKYGSAKCSANSGDWLEGPPAGRGIITANDTVEMTFDNKSITYYFGQAGRNGESKEMVIEKLGSRKVRLYPQYNGSSIDSRIEVVENGVATPILSAPKFKEYTVTDENNDGSNMTIKKDSKNSISISDIEVSNEEDLAKLRENLLPYPKAARVYAAPDKIDYVSQYRMAEGPKSKGLNSETYGYKNNVHPGQGGFGNHVIFKNGTNIDSMNLKVKTNAGEWSTADAGATLDYDQPVCMNGGMPTDKIYCKATSGQEGAAIISW